MKRKNNRGITLIALVVTIIVLLILAGIVISFALGENGLLEKAKEASEKTKKAEVKQEIEIAILDIQAELQLKEEQTDLDKDIIEKLPNKLQDITIYEDMIGEYKGYEYWIDEEYKVHVEGKTTNPIKIKVTPTYIGTSSCNISIEASSTEGEITKYQYRVNDENEQETDKNIFTLEDLEPETKYKITVIITDEKGNTKESMPITIKTSERTYIIKEGKLQVDGASAFGATVSQDENGYLKIVTTSSLSTRGLWYFPYEITNYKAVKIDSEIISKGSDSIIFLAIKQRNTSLNVDDLVRWKNCTGDTSPIWGGNKSDGTVKRARQIDTLNTDGLTGTYNIVYGRNIPQKAVAATMHVYNLWLEK